VDGRAGGADVARRERGVSLLDVVLVLAGLSFGFSGYRQGFVVGVLSFFGFLGGGVLGMSVAPELVGSWDPGLLQALVAVGIVLAAAVVGQVLAAFLGGRLRERITWHPARLVDATAGALTSVTAMLIVTWFVASALAQSPLDVLTGQVRESRVLLAVDRVMPDRASTLFTSFRDVLDRNGFPQVFSGIGAERILPVPTPDERVADTRAVRRAAGSIVKVLGVAVSCERQVEGSGFVYARERVMTNAHVVAGVSSPRVQIGGEGRSYVARVVHYDPRRDVAVLAVPDLPSRPLDFAAEAERGDSAVVAGFPEDGPFTAVPARIRAQQPVRGPDIYRRGEVTRDVYAVRAVVRQGNSGGPLLAPDGDVYGVVFAASLTDDETGYALTAAEVAGAAGAGASAQSRVGTGDCA